MDLDQFLHSKKSHIKEAGNRYIPTSPSLFIKKKKNEKQTKTKNSFQPAQNAFKSKPTGADEASLCKCYLQPPLSPAGPAQGTSSAGWEGQQVSCCVAGQERQWPNSSWVRWCHAMGREVGGIVAASTQGNGGLISLQESFRN